MSTAVIAILLALAAPAIYSVRAGAHRSTCAANLRSLGVAIQMYREDYGGSLPYADRLYHIRHGWTDPIDALAPYLDGASPPHVDEHGVVQSDAPFRCPSDPRVASETGLSYAYAPSQFMMNLTGYPLITEPIAAKMTTVGMYNTPPWTLWVFLDREGWHPKFGPDNASRKNALRFDGAISPASHDDILSVP